VAATFRLVCGTGPARIYHEMEGARGERLVTLARTADLVILGKGEGGDPTADRAVVEHLALSAGIPVLSLPATIPERIGQTVVIGWDGSREACRAAHDALPFLAEARRVVLCTVGEDPAARVEDAAAMLKRHGLEVQLQIVRIEDGSPGRVLCEQAQNVGADLLVMGAYGHARLRELVFGGATRYALTHATVPVLFSA
jgi:nucleotide-binding universal stress UspA family protein